MTAVAAALPGALLGSTVLMLFVLAVRGPVRRAIGPRVGYLLWALPAVRLLLPPLPDLFAALQPTASAPWTVLATGAESGLSPDPVVARWQVGGVFVVWLAGALAVFALQVVRHVRFCRRVRATATVYGRRGTVTIVVAAVDGPLAFGVFRRFVAVPRDFAARFDARERDLALAHECAHHARGDLVANWASLAILSAHWWNPIAWAVVGAFRDDQEFAVDAAVLAGEPTAARRDYARVLAKAVGLGALPVSNLTARSNLKGRLLMLGHRPLPPRRAIPVATALTVLAAAVLAATVSTSGTAAPAGKQAVTIGVKPDGAGGYALIVAGAAVAPGAPLPSGATLPGDFSPHGGCDLTPAAKPHAMAIKGTGGITTYTVMCASAAPAPVKISLAEGLASLKMMRGSVATQPASVGFPDAERRHALGAIDRSIREVEAMLATS